MCKILNCYIRKIVLSNVIMIFSILISLSGIIRLIDEFRKAGKVNYSVLEVIIYTVLSIPKDFELFFPISALIGSLLGLSVLEMHYEFVIMEASGYSKLQIVSSVITVAIPILLCSFITSEWILPNSEKMIYNRCNLIQNCDAHVKYGKINNFWFVDNNDFICIKRILNACELLDITLYRFDQFKKIKKIFFIERAIFADNRWSLFNLDELDFSDTNRVGYTRSLRSDWNIMLTPDLLTILVAPPNTLSISRLYQCIKYFNNSGQNVKYYKLIFWSKIASILSNIVMIITALSCTFGPLYRKKINVRLFFGIVIGFLFYILNQIFGSLILVYNIPLFFGAMLPSIIFLLMSIIIWRYF